VKTQGKIAWLVTWEGPESEYNGRCKVVAILPPARFQEKTIKSMLQVLHCSEYGYTLCEKMGFSKTNRDDSFFKVAYRNINPEFWYGHIPKQYLCARKVENLRCEESKKDCLANTLFWTELPKYISNPKYGPEGPMLENMDDALKEVIGKREAQYTYSIRPNIEEENKRRAKHKK
jgi:hypothetical protein